MTSYFRALEEIQGMTEKEVQIHFITTRILSFFSFIPNICLVLLIIFRKKYHNLGNILVFQLSLACILFISSYCFPLLENDPDNQTTGVCHFQAMINITFDIATMFFTLGIAITNYMAFVEPDKLMENKRIILLLISIISWIVPFIFGLCGIIFKAFQLGATKICWPRTTVYVSVFTGFIVIIFIVNMFYVIRLLIVIKRTISRGGSDIKYFGYFWHLIFYIIAQLLTHLPFIFDLVHHALYRFAYKESFPDVLWEKLLRDGSKTITGLIFAIVYCCNLEKWNEFKLFICCQSEVIINELDESNEYAEIQLEENDPEEFKRRSIVEEVTPL